MNQQLATLQQQVDSLFSNLSSLRNNVDMMGGQGQPQMFNQSPSAPFARSSSIPQTPGSNGPPPARRPSVAKHPRFQGPTSAAFNIGVAKSSLQTMGITGPEDTADDGAQTNEVTPIGSPRMGTVQHSSGAGAYSAPGNYQKAHMAHATKDPIWMLTKEETLRLVNVYQDEMGLMYPMLDIEKLLSHANMLFTFVEAANRSGLMQIALPGADSINDDQTNILKLVLACALVLEASGKSDLGKRLFEYVKPTVDAQLLGPPDAKGVQMLILTVRRTGMSCSEDLTYADEFRQCIISIRTRNPLPGGQWALPAACAWKLAFIVATHTILYSRLTRSETQQFVYFGHSMF